MGNENLPAANRVELAYKEREGLIKWRNVSKKKKIQKDLSGH